MYINKIFQSASCIEKLRFFSAPSISRSITPSYFCHYGLVQTMGPWILSYVFKCCAIKDTSKSKFATF
jgi:hypothetical protein